MDLAKLISIILGSSLLTGLMGFLLLKQSEKITNTVKSQLSWKEKACEAMGSIYFQMQRSSLAFERYVKAKTPEERHYIEQEVLLKSNSAVNNLILTQGYLIAPELLENTKKLLNHYDAWVEKYQRMRVTSQSEEKFVFVGPDGYPFPKELEQQLADHYLRLWNELYGKSN